MRTPTRWMLAGAACVVLVTSPVRSVSQTQMRSDAGAIEDFGRRVTEYDDLYCRVATSLPAVRVSANRAEIQAAVSALGDAIRAARVDARQGDLFTADAAVLFRRIIREEYGTRFREFLQMVQDDVPALSRAYVNGHWPGEAVTFMPPLLLQRFPALPAGIEYRFVNRDLVLWDSRADVILDVLPNAVPEIT